MCCFFTALVFFGPRLAILVWWLVNPLRFDRAFGSHWLLSLLAWLFIPWTTIMFLLVFPVYGIFDWIILGLGILADIASYSGGMYGNRNQIPGYN